MSRPPAFRCAAQADVRGDQLAGTASRERGWVLIEHPGPWPFAGFAELAIDPLVQAAVRQEAHTAGLRILLIRRHGRVARSPRRAWAVLRYERSGDHRQEWGTWTTDADLVRIVAAIGRDGRPGLPPVYLVCTHGVHDACCAIRGRPVAAALAERWPEATWESSHLSGDRYAATMLAAPAGVAFGRVTPSEAVEAIDLLRDGLVSAQHLRGYSDLTPPEQFAVAEVLRRFGPAGRDAIEVVARERDGDDVHLELRCTPPLPGRVWVDLRARLLPAAQLTCRAPCPSRPLAYDVTRFSTSG